METALAEITDLADPDTELEQDASGKWIVSESDDAEEDDDAADEDDE